MSEARQPPRAFLCHASDDDPLARRLGVALQEAGIDTFLDDWSIAAGESIRQRIDAGISDCTHFVVLLTPASIDKRWVNAEIDGGFVQKIREQAAFLPIRYNLPAERLSPLLAALHAPAVTDATFDSDVRRIIGDIYGISQKPPLGGAPEYVRPVSSQETGLSLGAEKIASLFAQRSTLGRRGDPKLTVDDFRSEASLTTEEIQIAIDELQSRGWVEPIHVLGCPPLGYSRVNPLDMLFIQGDRFFMTWDPREDAVRLAAELLNGERPDLQVAETAARLEWIPRRINPALSYLILNQAVQYSKNVNPTFVTGYIRRNNSIARFLRDHS